MPTDTEPPIGSISTPQMISPASPPKMPETHAGRIILIAAVGGLVLLAVMAWGYYERVYWSAENAFKRSADKVASAKTSHFESVSEFETTGAEKLKGDLNLAGDYDITDPKNPRFSVRLDGSVESNQGAQRVTFSADTELRSVGDKFYFKIN